MDKNFFSEIKKEQGWIDTTIYRLAEFIHTVNNDNAQTFYKTTDTVFDLVLLDIII